MILRWGRRGVGGLVWGSLFKMMGTEAVGMGVGLICLWRGRLLLMACGSGVFFSSFWLLPCLVFRMVFWGGSHVHGELSLGDVC